MKKIDNFMKEKTDTSNIQDWYTDQFEQFQKKFNGNGKSYFNKLRQDAIAHFSEFGFPTTRLEAWKYTDISPILKHHYHLIEALPQIREQNIQQYIFKKYSENLLVFINGEYATDFSSPNANTNDMMISSLEEAQQHHPDTIKNYVNSIAKSSDEPFTALNAAFSRQGAFIHIPANVILDEPIQLLYLSNASDTPFQCHPRNLIIMGKGSQAKIIESHHSLSQGIYFNNAVTEVFLDNQANLKHMKFQNDSQKAFRITRTQVNQKHDSVFNSVTIDLGGAIVRNNLGISIDGENSETNLYGFYLTNGRQHIDNHTNIDHLKPNCVSNELYKGILSDQARAVFSGTIYVARDAQKTNAFQANKNLLLSEEAEIDSKPQLKIFADDVKCTHGATIGRLDEEALFYLQQRGISAANAQNLLRMAFAHDVLDKIDNEPVKHYIEKVIHNRLNKEF
jgi:Fe-S cluster assembly protein SufD